MRLYTYFPSLDNDEVLWNVFEEPTQQVIRSFFFEDDAQEYMYFLEKGGAFYGFTPSFMLKAMPLTNLDEAFAAEFAAT
jgi:hypothetical protein